MLNTVEFYEERLEESYKKYFLYLERKECNYAECVLNAEISPNVYKLKRSVWAYHFSTPGRVLFLQNELSNSRIYIPLALEIKYPIKIK